MRHLHFNEPGYGGWEGMETETSRWARPVFWRRWRVPRAADARRTDEVLSVQTLDVACAFALETHVSRPLLMRFWRICLLVSVIVTTVETRIVEAHGLPRDGSTPRSCCGAPSPLSRRGAASAEPAVLPPARGARGASYARCAAYAPTAPQRRHRGPAATTADAEEIARLEARLEELRRRNNNAGDAMEESDDDDESMDGGGNMGYAGPEIFGPGRRLDSEETAPDPAPALAAAQEAEARRAALEEQRRKDVADKRAAFLALIAVRPACNIGKRNTTHSTHAGKGWMANAG